MKDRERDKRKEELLAELARRFKDSSTAMKSIAARIQAAASQSQEQARRLSESNAALRDHVGCNSSPLPFSYLEFVEFTTAEEFEKYRNLPVISHEDLKAADIDELCRRLVEENRTEEQI